MKLPSPKRAATKFKIWFSKKYLPYDYGDISKTERDVIRIFNTLVSHPSSELLTDPLSDKYYIKSVKTGIFVTISIRANEISIINHVYGYNVKISNRTMRGMQNTALMEIERRRSKLEKEYQSNIQHSLNHIAKTVKERL
jgi:hypothetical protein